MIGFVLEVILVSIVVSAISYALRLIPRYPSRFYGVLVQILNTVLLTLLLTYLTLNENTPGWVVLGSMIFLCLIVSIIAVNLIAKAVSKRPPPDVPPGTP